LGRREVSVPRNIKKRGGRTGETGGVKKLKGGKPEHSRTVKERESEALSLVHRGGKKGWGVLKGQNDTPARGKGNQGGIAKRYCKKKGNYRER